MICDLYFYVFYIGRPQVSAQNPTEDQRDFETISQTFQVLCHHKIADTSVLDRGTYMNSPLTWQRLSIQMIG